MPIDARENARSKSTPGGRLLLGIEQGRTAQVKRQHTAGWEAEDQGTLGEAGRGFFPSGRRVEQTGGEEERLVLLIPPAVAPKELPNGCSHYVGGGDLKEGTRCSIQRADHACLVPYHNGLGE